MQILTQYHSEIKSFPLSEARIGVFNKGRYSGFDTISARAGSTGIPINLSSSPRSVRSVGSGNSMNPLEATIITGHGVVIKVPGDVPLVVLTNSAGNAQDRIDTVYLEYIWEDSDTPLDPLINILQGIPGSGVAPVINSGTQVKIGEIHVPAGADDFTWLMYYPSPCPQLGDASLLDYHDELDTRYAQLSKPNRFRGTISVPPLEIAFDTTAETVVYTGDTTNALYLTNNFKAFTITGIEKTPGVPHEAGTRMNLFFYNLSATGSRFKRSTNGHPPGFDYNTQGIFGGSYFPIKNGDMFEVILDDYGTWRIIEAIDAFGGRLRTLWDNLDTILHRTSDPINYIKVGESNTAEAIRFTAAYSSSGNTAYATSDRLKVGINRAGLLEITGGFVVTQTLPVGWHTVFSLSPALNFERQIRGEIYSDSEPLNLTKASQYCKIENNGDFKVYWTSPSGWWVVNLIMSISSGIAPTGAGLPALW